MRRRRGSGWICNQRRYMHRVMPGLDPGIHDASPTDRTYGLHARSGIMVRRVKPGDDARASVDFQPEFRAKSYAARTRLKKLATLASRS